MAKNKRKPAATTSRLFVLALGLLVGFVMAFVLLLSRLPVDGIISQYNSSESQAAEVASMNFDYYSVLQEREAGRKPVQQVVAVEPPVVFMEPPREILPLNRSTTDGQIADRPLVRQPSEPRASAPEPQPASAPVTVPDPVPVQPRVTPKIDVPAQAQAQVQPRVQTGPPPRILPQPEVRPQAPTRAPVKEILASDKRQDSYYVEVGNYRENNEALHAQATLRDMGLEPFIVVRQDSSGAFGHRVRIGPFLDQALLNATREQLRNSGVTPKLIRVKG